MILVPLTPSIKRDPPASLQVQSKIFRDDAQPMASLPEHLPLPPSPPPPPPPPIYCFQRNVAAPGKWYRLAGLQNCLTKGPGAPAEAERD